MTVHNCPGLYDRAEFGVTSPPSFGVGLSAKDAETAATDAAKAIARAAADSRWKNHSCKDGCGSPWFHFAVDSVAAFSQTRTVGNPFGGELTIYIGVAQAIWHLDVKCETPGEWHWPGPVSGTGAKSHRQSNEPD